jgi:hypothetical protein
MGMTVENAMAGGDGTLNHANTSTTEPASTVLPEGTGTFDLPNPRVSSTGLQNGDGSINAGNTEAKYTVSGVIHRDYKFVSGIVTLYFGGVVADGVSLSKASYNLLAVPDGVASGTDNDDRNHFVQFQAEDGSVAKQDVNNRATTFDVSLNELRVVVETVDGDRADKAEVIIDNKRFSTNSDGEIVIGSSGTPDITAVLANVTKQADLAGGSAEVTIIHSGVEGQVRTPSGGAISNATVTLFLDDGTPLAETKTDENGTYIFERAPVGADLIVQSEPFTRSFTGGSEGQSILKNLPFDLDDVASVDLSLEDEQTGEPVAQLPTSIQDSLFSALSTDDGEAALIEQVPNGETETREVVLGENDERYQTTVGTVTLIGGESVELTASLERKPTLTNK